MKNGGFCAKFFSLVGDGAGFAAIVGCTCQSPPHRGSVSESSSSIANRGTTQVFWPSSCPDPEFPLDRPRSIDRHALGCECSVRLEDHISIKVVPDLAEIAGIAVSALVQNHLFQEYALSVVIAIGVG
jgi:hypothetical protein